MTALHSTTRQGFALVVTVSLMVLLALVAIGMLSLSSVALRSGSQTDAISTARANARLSLMLALGELQRQAGSDTRVTARADILSEENPPVLGVWRSWEGLNHETSGAFAGRPKAPAYDYRTMKDNAYSSGSPDQGRFLAWLTSANSTGSAAAAATSSVPDTSRATDKVVLLGPGSVGSVEDRENLQIHLVPTLVSSGQQSGGTAWWVGGENQKAYIPKPEADAPRGSAMRKQAVLQAKSHGTADPKPFGLDSVLTDPKRGKTEAEVNKALSIGQVDLLAPSQSGDDPDTRRSREFYHDLTTASLGLLTNTATGGWRKDMSLLSESWDRQPLADLPVFRVTPEPVLNKLASRASVSDPFAARSLFYPWATYTTRYSGGLQQVVSTWDNLMDYARFYKRADVSAATTGRRTITGSAVPHYGGLNNTDLFNHLHKVRVFPVVARIQWVFSHFAQESATDDPDNPGQKLLTPKLVMTPVITIWNPYDVELTPAQNLNFELKILPVALNYEVGGSPNANYNAILFVNPTTQPLTHMPSLLDYGGGGLNKYATCTIDKSQLVLKPGETRVFSPVANDLKVPATGIGGPGAPGHRLDLQPGVRLTGGHLYPVRNTAEGTVGPKPASTSIKANARFDTRYNAFTWGGAIIRAEGAGVYLEMSPPNAAGNWSDSIYTIHYRTSYSPEIANTLHPPITGGNMLSTTLGAVKTTPMPFMSTIFGTRMTTPTHDAAKGFVQCSPFGHFSPTYYRDTTQYQYTGTGHPINSRFDYSFVAHTSGNDGVLPNAGSNNNGYIITGVNSSNGVPRAVIAELPSRPLASLAELAGWDLRFENPAPPFAFNLVGNSDATPLIPSNAVLNASESSKSDNFKNDDSYCANHLLFDDWFFSSISEDPATFGGVARSQAVVYGEFVAGTTSLANRAYKPIPQDQAYVVSRPSADLYRDHVNPADSWKTIASRLEVEGMFNVNSTSVAAWRALLGHARNQRVLYINNTGTVADGGVKQHPVSRFAIAGEAEAGTAVAGALPEASQITGYRTLDDDFLDELAVEVVKQVRLRGPFLSLAEFINRQLSNNEQLALAGALQAALNELTQESDANHPLKSLQEIATEAMKNPVEAAGNENKTGYVFAAAAAGHSFYGVPGWTRQADILRPLAPILSARDDTFVIRGYGDARDAGGKVIANAVCEAVVKRTRDYVDPVDAADSTTTLTSAANKVFGRRFEIISFRWLSPDEV